MQSHPILMTAWWLPGSWGYWWPRLNPPAGTPALGGYRVIPQKSLLQSIPRMHITCCVLPQQWDKMVPCHCMHRGLLVRPCSQN